MQGTVVMLLALSGLGCHHKKVEPAYATSCYSSCYSETSCYSSCYSSGCYSSCYSETSCYSSCYSSGYSSCYSSCYSGASYSPSFASCYSCYSSCYSAKRHHHGLFGRKRNHCMACAPPPPIETACDPCGGSMPVYGTYTPVYDGYASSQMPSMQAAPAPQMTTPMTPPATPAPTTPPPTPAPEQAPTTPPAPSPGNPAPPPTPAPAPAAGF